MGTGRDVVRWPVAVDTMDLVDDTSDARNAELRAEAAELRAENERLRQRAAMIARRAAGLASVISRLASAVRTADVAEIIVEAGNTALEAHSGGLWRISDDRTSLVLARSTNYPPEALERVRTLPLRAGIPIADAVLAKQPVWLASRAEYERRYPASEARTREVSPIEYATAALPIMLDDEVLGVLALTFAEVRQFDADERSFLMFLVSHCAHGFERARLYESELEARRCAEHAQEAAEVAQARATFIAQASAALGSSLDYEDTLRNVAALAVPRMADWCGVELGEIPEQARQVAVAHVDPAKVQLAQDLRTKYPPDFAATTGWPQVMRTGVSEIYPEIPQALLIAGAQDEEHLRIIRELGLVSAMVVPIKDRGRTVGVLSFVISHSARRYTPDDVLMAEQLAERAGAAIANATLYDQAVKAIRLRDEFLLIAGHELRTPLAAMSLHHESLLAARPEMPITKVKERAAKLVEQSNRMSRLIDELLDVSRISAGRLTLERTDVDLGELVSECADRMREDLLRARCELRVAATPVVGHWDRGRLDQVVTNLLSNASKYGKGHPIEVAVTHDAGGAQLTVRDHGIGIAAADQARIFERFERAVPVRNFGGLGLGLWIVRQLVEAHGGTISVASVPGDGATFCVRLPLR